MAGSIQRAVHFSQGVWHVLLAASRASSRTQKNRLKISEKILVKYYPCLLSLISVTSDCISDLSSLSLDLLGFIKYFFCLAMSGLSQ